MSRRPFFPSSDRVLVAVLALLFGPALAYGRWYATKDPIEILERMERNRVPPDSAQYASALYHASHARLEREARWGLTGYASQGLAGAVVAAALFASTRVRR